MIIDIDTKTRIKGTSTCWQLERSHIRKGERAWGVLGYYTTFAAAVAGAAQREVRTHHAHGVAEAIAACEQVATKYKTILDEVGYEG